MVYLLELTHLIQVSISLIHILIKVYDIDI